MSWGWGDWLDLGLTLGEGYLTKEAADAARANSWTPEQAIDYWKQTQVGYNGPFQSVSYDPNTNAYNKELAPGIMNLLNTGLGQMFGGRYQMAPALHQAAGLSNNEFLSRYGAGAGHMGNAMHPYFQSGYAPGYVGGSAPGYSQDNPFSVSNPNSSQSPPGDPMGRWSGGDESAIPSNPGSFGGMGGFGGDGPPGRSPNDQWFQQLGYFGRPGGGFGAGSGDWRPDWMREQQPGTMSQLNRGEFLAEHGNVLGGLAGALLGIPGGSQMGSMLGNMYLQNMMNQYNFSSPLPPDQQDMSLAMAELMGNIDPNFTASINSSQGYAPGRGGYSGYDYSAPSGGFSGLGGGGGRGAGGGWRTIYDIYDDDDEAPPQTDN